MTSQRPRVVLASNNQGKLREFEQLFQAFNLEVIPQSAFAVSDADETGLSFVENAIIKARHACQLSGLPAIADDSGLEVDALNGAPGIYSARFAGEHGNDAANNDKLLSLLEDTPAEQRSARFRCVIVMMKHAQDPTPLICQGTWEGTISNAPSGDNGFGYDPVFYPAEHNCTSAELDKATKNSISHRARAMQQLSQQLDQQLRQQLHQQLHRQQQQQPDQTPQQSLADTGQ